MWNNLDLECPHDDYCEYQPQEQYLIEDLHNFIPVLRTAARSLTSEDLICAELKALKDIQRKYTHIFCCDEFLVPMHREDGKQIAECRVRFLSFLGIGKNVKHCGFIVHTAQDDFVAHIFHCEPSSGALCKTIEAACKLRYQKCLDSHRQDSDRKMSEAQKKGLGTALKNVFGTFFLTRLTKSTES